MVNEGQPYGVGGILGVVKANGWGLDKLAIGACCYQF